MRIPGGVTHTYALLEVSPAAYQEITDKLRAAGYEHAINAEGEADMHGIALVPTAPAPQAPPQWQPIEAAPNDKAILVAYDNGTIDLISAVANTYDWHPHPGKIVAGIARPTYWMPAPPLPEVPA